jgi:hypothetical protein
MTTGWLYQIRIKVDDKTSTNLRNKTSSSTANQIIKIAERHGTTPICTFDAFSDYCNQAEKNGIEHYSLYTWTKQTIENPDKRKKHLNSFAFYKGFEQVYEESLAKALHTDLIILVDRGEIEELKLIDSNPENNPQPPKA